MNLWKVEMTIKQAPEQHLEDKEYPWILEKLRTALIKMEDQDVSTTTHIDIWRENTGNQRDEKMLQM